MIMTQHRRSLRPRISLEITICFVFLLALCSAQGRNTKKLHCVYQGTILQHGDALNIDACTKCVCDSGSVSCNTQRCPATKCDKAVTAEGECCPHCPTKYLVVESVTPKVRSKNHRYLYQGRDNNLDVKVKVRVSETAGNASDVTGKRLWALGIWLSPNKDTGLPRFAHIEQILSDRQSSQNFYRHRKFSLRDIVYRFNDPTATCDDMKYICVELRRGEDVRSDHFKLGGSLVGCSTAPKCNIS